MLGHREHQRIHVTITNQYVFGAPGLDISPINLYFV